MAEVNPPGFLQNAGNVHTAQITRQLVNHLSWGTQNSNTLRARGGVSHPQGGGLSVSQAGAPNMSVDVASGNALIPGTEDSKQGMYSVQNDATKNVAIAAADPSLPRIDLIVFKVQDSFYSGVANTSSIVAVTGTPNASPSAPAAPANSLILAQIAVGAAVSSIVNGNITDKRRFLAGAGGILICGSGSRPPFNEITQSGAFIFETDTQLVRRWDGASSSWPQVSPYVQVNTLGGTTATVTFSNIPTSMRRVRIDWTARGTNGSANSIVQMRLNGDSTAGHYLSNVHQTNNTTAFAPAPNPNGTDRWSIGICSAASVPSNNYGTGSIDIFNWNGAHQWAGANWRSHTYSDVVGNSGTFYGGGVFAVNAPYTSITLLLDAGSFATNSMFRLEAWE